MASSRCLPEQQGQSCPVFYGKCQSPCMATDQFQEVFLLKCQLLADDGTDRSVTTEQTLELCLVVLTSGQCKRN